MSSSDEFDSIRLCFNKARSIFEKHQMNESYKLFTKCAALLRSNALFSLNETIADVATNDIIYLLVFYYMGESSLQAAGSGEIRLFDLKRAENSFITFITFCDAYNIMAPQERNLAEQVGVLNRDNDSRTDKFSYGETAEERRNRKIESFHREKKLEAEEKVFWKLRSFSSGTSEDNDDDEESNLRNFALRTIELAVIRTLRNLETIDLEQRMLKEHLDKTDANGPKSIASADNSEKIDVRLDDNESLKPGPLLDRRGRPLRPFVLLGDRNNIRESVFRPDYNLPTMTIDEYLEEEIKRNGIIMPDKNKQSSKSENENEDDDKDESADKETYKQRQWDEFTDANPRGSGNRMVNRG